MLVHDRDAFVERLVSHGVICGYAYDPPLDDTRARSWWNSPPTLSRLLVRIARVSGRPAPGPPDHQWTEEGTAATARPSLPTPVPATTPPASLGQ
jgi:hypothetical protein